MTSDLRPREFRSCETMLLKLCENRSSSIQKLMILPEAHQVWYDKSQWSFVVSPLSSVLVYFRIIFYGKVSEGKI